MSVMKEVSVIWRLSVMSRLSVILLLSVIQLLSLMLGVCSRGAHFSSIVMSGERALSSVMSSTEMSSLISFSVAEGGILRAFGLLGRRLELLHLIFF